MDQVRTRVSELLSDLQRRGVSGPAANWVARALHPPADHLGPQHVPDESFRPVVPIVLRPSVTIEAPASIAPDATWDLCIVCLPGDVNAAYYLAAPSGTDFSKTNIGSGAAGVLHLFSSAPVQDLSCLDPLSGSEGVYTSYGPTSGHYSYRHTFSSLTAYMTASSLYDGGTVTCAQLNDGPAPHGAVFRSEHSPTYFPLATISAFTVPLTESEITAVAPSARVAPAKEGIYMPFRLLGPSQKFVSRSTQLGTSFVDVDTTPTMVIGSETSVGLVGAIPVVLSNMDDGTYTVPYWMRELTVYGANGHIPCISSSADCGYDRVAVGVTIFRGLNHQSSITLRMFVGLELIPAPVSPLRTMVAVPPPPDKKALDLYYQIVAGMPMAYPSRDNGLGLIIPKILSALRFLAPIVLPHVVSAAKDVFSAVVAPKQAAPAKKPGKKKKSPPK